MIQEIMSRFSARGIGCDVGMDAGLGRVPV